MPHEESESQLSRVLGVCMREDATVEASPTITEVMGIAPTGPQSLERVLALGWI